MFKAWAQLVRLPNVFTAPADVIAGASLTLCFEDLNVLKAHFNSIVVLCLSSVCFYSAGMILNDVFDFQEDLRDRPFRPIPSGRIHRGSALVCGLLLLVLGSVLAFGQIQHVLLWPYGHPGLLLPVAILAYNLWLKRTFLGPVAMGICRGLNLLLGAFIIPIPNILACWAAWTVIVYITGVTTIARDETMQGKRGAIQFGIGLIAISVVSVTAMTFMFIIRQFHFSQLAVVVLLLFWTVLLFTVLGPVYRNPSPQHVGSAIKYCIFGLVIVETMHSTLGVGFPGLTVLLLLIPANYLGRFIYST